MFYQITFFIYRNIHNGNESGCIIECLRKWLHYLNEYRLLTKCRGSQTISYRGVFFLIFKKVAARHHVLTTNFNRLYLLNFVIKISIPSKLSEAHFVKSSMELGFSKLQILRMKT